MIVLDEPYVSQQLLDYLELEQLPVLQNSFAQKAALTRPNLNLLNDERFVGHYQASKDARLYTVSEYAFDWLYGALLKDPILDQVALLKDKIAFRKASSSVYKHMLYHEIPLADLADFDIEKVTLPVVLKPAVGFLSAGVYTIASTNDWKRALVDIKGNFVKQAELFPERVVEKASFILESYISGREFAIDLYFKDNEPVIINIFEHLFSSDADVSDRLYRTSKPLFDTYLVPFTEHISRLNKVLHLQNIPVHMELRVENETIVPIEINPLRFAGMCLNEVHTCITGKHPLSYYFSNTTPNYEAMWQGKEQKAYCFSVFEKPENSVGRVLEEADLVHLFSNMLEFRPVDNSDLNIAAFVLSEGELTDESELHNILKFDINSIIK